MNQKEYYTQLIESHKRILAKSRKLIEQVIDKIAEEIKQHEQLESEFANNPEQLSESYKTLQLKFWWGDKESASSILNRLIVLLLKLIPLEIEIAKCNLEGSDEEELKALNQKAELNQQDIEILDNYLQRYKQVGQDNEN